MARILFFPLLLIILAVVVFLVLRIRSMIALGKSKDVTLSRPTPYGDDVHGLIGSMFNALKDLPAIQFQSEIHVNFRKVMSYARIQPESVYNKISAKGAVLEITRESDLITVKSGKSSPRSIDHSSRWLGFWCGVSKPEESLRIFTEDGLKVTAGDTGKYMDRLYTEIIVLSHALKPGANEAFRQFAGLSGRIYGKDLSDPEINIRNFMVRILVSNITSLPDYIETKYNIFRDDQFVCDYLGNTRLLY